MVEQGLLLILYFNVHSTLVQSIFAVLLPGGGGYMASGLTGVCRSVFRKVPYSHYQKPAFRPTLMLNFDGELPIKKILANFQPHPPMLKEICGKRALVYRIHAQKTHPFGRHIPVPPASLYLLGFFPPFFIFLFIWPMLQILTFTFLSSFLFRIQGASGSIFHD